jgi:hypothetical protein
MLGGPSTDRQVRSQLVVEVAGAAVVGSRDGMIGRRGENGKPVGLRLARKLLEGLAQRGSKLIERQSGNSPRQCLVSEPAVDRAGIDAARSANLGKA